MHLCFLHPVVVPMSIDSLKSINLTVIENDVSVRVRIKFATKGEGRGREGITLLDKNSRTISRRCGIFGGQSRPDYNYNVNKVQHAALLNSTSTKRIQIHKERKKKSTRLRFNERERLPVVKRYQNEDKNDDKLLSR